MVDATKVYLASVILPWPFQRNYVDVAHMPKVNSRDNRSLCGPPRNTWNEYDSFCFVTTHSSPRFPLEL